MGHPAADGLTLDEGPLSDGDRSLLLDLLFDHRADHVRGFLRECERPVSGTKEQLRERVTGYLADGTVAGWQLVDLLDAIEGWGNQHVYLLRAKENAPVLTQWADEQAVRGILRHHKLDHLFNQRRRLVMPELRQLVSIDWSVRRVRFVWVEGRVWRERRPDLDRREEPPRVAEADAPAPSSRLLVFDAYEVYRGRGIIAFELDLVSGIGSLFIQRLPSGNDYAAVRETIVEELQPVIDVRSLDPVRVGRSIVRLESVDGVRRRQIEHTTERGSRIQYVSAERDADAFADPALEHARKGAGSKVVGRMGNFYWRLSEDQPEVHVKIYAPDNRVGFFGECAESQVRHVLRLIRQHCR